MRKTGLVFFIALLVTATASAAEYRIVAHPGVPVSSLTKVEVANIFMKKTVKWSDGSAAIPVDQVRESAVRARFTVEIHKKPVPAVTNYWNQQVFAGRNIPPVEKASDEAVIAMLRKTPGGIGYVSPAANIGDLKGIDVR